MDKSSRLCFKAPLTSSNTTPVSSFKATKKSRSLVFFLSHLPSSKPLLLCPVLSSASMEFCSDDGGDLGFNFPSPNNQYFNGNMYLSEIDGFDDETMMTSYLQDLMDCNSPVFNRDFPSSCDCSSNLEVQGASCLSCCLPSEHSNESETTDVSMGTSMEESVLQEFEALMAQLSDKVRIGFRDTFYRLAEDSRSSLLDQNQNVSTPRSRFEERNVIDSAVANLMFDRMETNMRDFPVLIPSEVEEATMPMGCTSNPLENCYFSPPPCS